MNAFWLPTGGPGDLPPCKRHLPFSIAGALRHWTLSNVNLTIALFIAVSGIIGAIIGATLIENIPPIYAKRALAILLIFAAMRLWLSK